MKKIIIFLVVIIVFVSIIGSKDRNKNTEPLTQQSSSIIDSSSQISSTINTQTSNSVLLIDENIAYKSKITENVKVLRKDLENLNRVHSLFISSGDLSITDKNSLLLSAYNLRDIQKKIDSEVTPSGSESLKESFDATFTNYANCIEQYYYAVQQSDVEKMNEAKKSIDIADKNLDILLNKLLEDK